MPLPSPSPSSAALITGASSGIGEQLARRLAGRGHGLIITARRRERLEALARELSGEHGVRVEVLPADLGDATQRNGLVEAVHESGLTVEVLVNCAGFGVYDAFTTSAHERELEQVRLLVEAPVDLTHRFLPAMVERGRGAVINISSISGFAPAPYNAGYAAAKSYLLLLSEALHAEVGSQGVTVTVVCPGPVQSGFQAASDNQAIAERLPRALWVSAERVAADALAAAEAGRRTVIPGGPAVRAAFAGNRYAPPALALALTKRAMRRG